MTDATAPMELEADAPSLVTLQLREAAGGSDVTTEPRELDRMGLPRDRMDFNNKRPKFEAVSTVDGGTGETAKYVGGSSEDTVACGQAVESFKAYLGASTIPALQTLSTISLDPHFKFSCCQLDETWFIIMATCHVDHKLIAWGAKYGMPRGYPLLWNPSASAFRAAGFYPKFSNDSRQADSVAEYENVTQICFFKKWSGFLCQVLAWRAADGALCWTTSSKNSGDASSEFVRNGAEVMAPYMTAPLVKEMAERHIHICLELMHQRDQGHGARVLRSDGIVTMVATGLHSGMADPAEEVAGPPAGSRFVEYWPLDLVVGFCLR
jgi:hypothetical protein